MNDQKTKTGIGYDPCDQNSFPYQANDPPFSRDDLDLDPLTWRLVHSLTEREMLAALLEACDGDRYEGYRTLDMTLRLFERLIHDPAFTGIAYPEIFKAAAHTAIIWEFG